MNLPIERLRIAADLLTGLVVEDVQTVAGLDLFRARDLQVELGLFYDTEFITDLTNITSITLEVKRDNERRGVALMSQTVLLAAMNGSLTEAQWDAETSQHCLFTFTAVESALPMPDGLLQQTFWIRIFATRTDGKKVTILAGALKVYDDGLNDVTSVVAAGAYSYIYVAGKDTATDGDATGFTVTQTAIDAKNYIAILFTNTVLTPALADFAGLWRVNSTSLMAPATSAGTPEGSVTRAAGMICYDTTNGDLYIKTAGTSNTNWLLFYNSVP